MKTDLYSTHPLHWQQCDAFEFRVHHVLHAECRYEVGPGAARDVIDATFSLLISSAGAVARAEFARVVAANEALRFPAPSAVPVQVEGIFKFAGEDGKWGLLGAKWTIWVAEASVDSELPAALEDWLLLHPR
ncbi:MULTISPECIES: hypothetical protein [unclassified Variovorax]|uniref:hypothetical protein n=1 Tax=unclassified Variovorax TaxID=663243 RepID=UPI0013181221|nr:MULTISPECIES: hypothetical protein [unclassified Variovorax]VTU42474.1 hypothetical protein H6P1_00200 [Variovorax sp. PBL-H6]VTU43907.1 hypothetical protein SRS16P1_00702 [Variovorax sp. SRS16]VTU43986.1 hypothetical protein E5P1_00695 [Variovorax sp. PBL-E5]